MELIIDTTKKAFDTTLVAKGYLVYAKHRSWNDGHSGIITAVTEDKLTVQYHPEIGNVMNHFFIPATEVADGEWLLRWSKDLSEIGEVSMTEDGNGD